MTLICLCGFTLEHPRVTPQQVQERLELTRHLASTIRSMARDGLLHGIAEEGGCPMSTNARLYTQDFTPGCRPRLP